MSSLAFHNCNLHSTVAQCRQRPIQRRSDALLQLRLQDEIDMLGFVDLGCIVEKAAEENDLAGWRILLEAARQTDAVLLRHADIQQSNVRLDAGLA